MKNDSLQIENDQSIPLALIYLKWEIRRKNELFRKRKKCILNPQFQEQGENRVNMVEKPSRMSINLMHYCCCFLQDTQRRTKNLPSLDPEVLSVFVPPFISRDDIHTANTSANNLNRSKRRSFRKKKEKPKFENIKSVNGEQKVPDTEDITVPKDIDLIGLPQLCFPGTVGLSLLSENCFNMFFMTHNTIIFTLLVNSTVQKPCLLVSRSVMRVGLNWVGQTRQHKKLQQVQGREAENPRPQRIHNLGLNG